MTFKKDPTKETVISMSKSIDSEEEYERRKALLEKHKEQERESFKKTVISRSVTGILGVTGITDAIHDAVENATDNE